MRASTKVFELIPSVQTRIEKPAPMALLPALPVRLKGNEGPTQYAVIDTGAQISFLSSIVAQNLAISRETIGTKIVTMTSGESIRCEIVKAVLILCDERFSPWLRFEGVPMALVPGSQAPTGEGHLVLGYDSCLSNLKLTIDYPRKKLRVSAPSKFLISAISKKHEYVPSRIKEGDKLIKLGSYNAALAVIAAGIEEAVLSNLGTRPESATLGQLRSQLAEEDLPERFRIYLDSIARLRNRAVHGEKGESITMREAKDALRDAKAFVTYLRELGDKGEPGGHG
ncbi:MAG: hypothetical protein ACE5IQ_05630 [Candidatus Methylomirabilales bacterium]